MSYEDSKMPTTKASGDFWDMLNADRPDNLGSLMDTMDHQVGQEDFEGANSTLTTIEAYMSKEPSGRLPKGRSRLFSRIFQSGEIRLPSAMPTRDKILLINLVHSYDPESYNESTPTLRKLVARAYNELEFPPIKNQWKGQKVNAAFLQTLESESHYLASSEQMRRLLSRLRVAIRTNNTTERNIIRQEIQKLRAHDLR